MATRATAAGAVSAVVAAVACAGAVSVWAAAPPSATSAAGARLVPPDGASTVFELTSSNGTTFIVQEHQRTTGFSGLSSLPSTLGAYVLSQIDGTDDAGTDDASTDSDALASVELWRVTSRQLRDDLVGPPTTDVYQLTDDGVLRLAGVGGAYPTVFEPPLLVMPADPRPGERWAATGSALLDGLLVYDWAAEVREVDRDDCATVHTTLELTMSGEPFSTITSTERWCPGRGLVEGTAAFEELGSISEIAIDTVDDPIERLGSQPRPSPGEALPADDPNGWAPSTPALVARDSVFGDMPVDGITAMPPVVGDDGLVVASMVNGGDLIGLRLGAAPDGDADPAPRLVEQWRAHPGGEALAVHMLGDLIVVSTAERTVVAYDLNGVRRWQATTDDLVLGDAVRVAAGDSADSSGGLIVVQDLSGRLTAWSADDGRVVWRAATRADSDLAPVTLGVGIVVAADRSGDVIAIDAADGQVRWRLGYEGIDAIGAVGDLLVVDTGSGTLHAVEPTGTERWSAEIDIWSARIDDVGGRIGLLGGEETAVVDPADGSLEWTVPSAESVDGIAAGAGRGVLAVHRRNDVCLYDADGAELRCWAPPTVSDAVRLFLVATPAELWTIDGTLDVLRIGPPVELGSP